MIHKRNDGTVCYSDRSGRELQMEIIRIEKGEVIDDSEGSKVLRAWKSGDEIHILNLHGHDVQWPHYVSIYPLSSENFPIKAIRVMEVHQYLSSGFGIPPAKP